jgi:hypothetical protein
MVVSPERALGSQLFDYQQYSFKFTVSAAKFPVVVKSCPRSVPSPLMGEGKGEGTNRVEW